MHAYYRMFGCIPYSSDYTDFMEEIHLVLQVRFTRSGITYLKDKCPFLSQFIDFRSNVVSMF